MSEIPNITVKVRGPTVTWLLVVPYADPYAKGRWRKPKNAVNCMAVDAFDLLNELTKHAPEGYFVVRYSTKEARPA